MTNQQLKEWLYGWYQNCKETTPDCAAQCTLKLAKECNEAYQEIEALIMAPTAMARIGEINER